MEIEQCRWVFLVGEVGSRVEVGRGGREEGGAIDGNIVVWLLFIVLVAIAW
jgi:hypothetical protein